MEIDGSGKSKLVTPYLLHAMRRLERNDGQVERTEESTHHSRMINLKQTPDYHTWQGLNTYIGEALPFWH
jgi:hypothetical protein